jgi:hypothetical protein
VKRYAGNTRIIIIIRNIEIIMPVHITSIGTSSDWKGKIKEDGLHLQESFPHLLFISLVFPDDCHGCAVFNNDRSDSRTRRKVPRSIIASHPYCFGWIVASSMSTRDETHTAHSLADSACGAR